METPKNCFNCCFLNDYPACTITGTAKEKGFDILRKVMPNCPLLEVTECKNCIFCSSYLDCGEVYYECTNENGLFSDVNEDSFCSRSIHK